MNAEIIFWKGTYRRQGSNNKNSFFFCFYSLIASQERQDSLDAEFARVSQQLVKARDQVQQLEEEVTTQLQLMDTTKGKGQDQYKTGLDQTQTQLTKVKADIQKLEMERERIMEKMTKLDTETEETKAQPVVMPPVTTKPTPVSAKSRKAQKSKK